MIGRDAELAALTEEFAATAETGPHITVVGGEAGIGKSRLLDEFRASVAESAVVVRGQCVEFGTVGLPYVPLAGVFRGLAAVSASQFFYLSCNAQTLSRDLLVLREFAPAYRVAAIKAFDMFPQTTHVETLVRLERS